MTRYEELLECFRRTEQPRCSIIDSGTTWEGERWTETLLNGDSMTIAGQTVPLHTQFLVCKEHEPK